MSLVQLYIAYHCIQNIKKLNRNITVVSVISIVEVWICEMLIQMISCVFVKFNFIIGLMVLVFNFLCFGIGCRRGGGGHDGTPASPPPVMVREFEHSKACD